MVQGTEIFVLIRLHAAAETHMHTHTHTSRVCVKEYVLKSREIHQGLRAFEKHFNDPSRHETLISSITAERMACFTSASL